MKRRIVAMSVACALWPSPSLRAAEPAPTAEPDPLAVAKEKHAEGQAEFDAADYDGAIEAWTAALKALPIADEGSATNRTFILYNIAAARERLFDLEQDVTQLKQAKILLERFEASLDEVYSHDPARAEAERSRVREKIAAIDARIAAAQPVETPAPAPEPEPAPDVAPHTDAPPQDGRGKGLMIGGGVLLGLGAVAIGGLAASLVIGESANDIGDLDRADMQGRADRFASGEQANDAAIAMAVLAPLLVAGGVALLVIGARRNKARRVAAAPSVGGRIAGVVLSGRF